jgi:chorismate mutase
MTDDNLHNQLTAAALRAEIEEIDQQLMLLLGLRFRCTDDLSQLVIDEGNDSAPCDGDSRIAAMEEVARDTGVSPDLAVTLMRAVARAVIENHERIKACRSH